MKKPYLLIAGYKYYPSCDTGDWKGCFETYEKAKEYLEAIDKDYYDWYEIVDLREWAE
jgi:hypothetical protein